MKQLLSLKRINENSSYPVETTGEDGFYQFFTDGGVHYSVGFMEDDILLSQNSYQLIIANINNHKSPRDHKVRDTIIAIVDEFFRNNNSTLLYICETGDSKQSMRSRLFEYWFSTYNRKALFTMISSSIVDEEGVVNFATIILRNDNPNLSDTRIYVVNDRENGTDLQPSLLRWEIQDETGKCLASGKEKVPLQLLLKPDMHFDRNPNQSHEILHRLLP